MAAAAVTFTNECLVSGFLILNAELYRRHIRAEDISGCGKVPRRLLAVLITLWSLRLL